jgi:IMP dehydrogenase
VKILEKTGLTFNDVLLVPQRTDLESRMDADTSSVIGNISLRIPIISANMDSITGIDMAIAMGRAGGAGILHRYDSPEKILKSIMILKDHRVPAIPSVGVKAVDWSAACLYRQLTDAICLDVAHGDSTGALQMVKELCDRLHFKTIIAGNVATKDGALRLVSCGANVIKVGIGPGSVCETRSVTGHGVPQFTAIMDVCEALRGTPTHVIADGGMNNSGDIVKALAAGAHAVMTGSLLAGTKECNKKRIYRGMASAEAQKEWLGKVNNNAPEGISQDINERGPVSEVLEKLVGGIRSGLSYSGSESLHQLREKAVFMKVSPTTMIENGTRKL